MNWKFVSCCCLLILSLALINQCVGLSDHVEQNKQSESPIHREATEWCNVWIPNGDKTDLPRVLLVGDSITKHYFKDVEKSLEGSAYCANLTTSACAADPLFMIQLRGVIENFEFDVIHFNNGIHGVEYTEQEYQRGYEDALALIRDKQPTAKIVIALSTPTKEGGSRESYIPRIQARNTIASELAKKINAPVNDLFLTGQGHPEYYYDNYHFCKKAVAIQAGQVAKQIREILQ